MNIHTLAIALFILTSTVSASIYYDESHDKPLTPLYFRLLWQGALAVYFPVAYLCLCGVSLLIFLKALIRMWRP